MSDDYTDDITPKDDDVEPTSDSDFTDPPLDDLDDFADLGSDGLEEEDDEENSFIDSNDDNEVDDALDDEEQQ